MYTKQRYGQKFIQKKLMFYLIRASEKNPAQLIREKFYVKTWKFQKNYHDSEN